MGERKSALEMTAEEIEDEAIRLGDELPTSDTESDVRIDILRSDRDYFLGVIRELKAPPLVSVTPSIVQDDMDDAEAMREGVTPDEMTTPLEAFVKVWREIHGEGSWEQKTPTWRYEWEPMEGTK